MLLTSCATTMDQLRNVGREPKLTKVEGPQYKQTYNPVMWQDLDAEANKLAPKNNNSLWQPGSRAFFRDQRARRVGDILKVNIKIKDNAAFDNKSAQVRKNKENTGVTNIFGAENKLKGLYKGTFDPSKLINLSSDRDVNGSGKIARNESVNTQIAAMVAQILPNGNLVINGHQEIKLNYELREVHVEGIVRPEDISSDNSVDADQIAEARISYGGRGHITNMQQPRVGHQVLDAISPF
jgi:flagellar L-ring protein precursor FlgH